MTGTAPSKPLRADARRNYERLVAAAREVFTERGSDTSLEEVARRADVGIGTLYRHFPNRLDLVEAVYRDDVAQLEQLAADYGDDPWDDLVRFVDRLVDYVATKKALFTELSEAVGRDQKVMSGCRESLRRSAGEVLARAQKAGIVREDVDGADLLRLLHGLTVTPMDGRDDVRRLIRVVLDGLRVPATEPR